GKPTVNRLGVSQFKKQGSMKTTEGAGLVLMLRTALLGDDDQAAGRVAEADGGGGFVAFLSTGAAGTVRIDLALRQQLLVGQSSPGGPIHGRAPNLVMGLLHAPELAQIGCVHVRWRPRRFLRMQPLHITAVVEAEGKHPF